MLGRFVASGVKFDSESAAQAAGGATATVTMLASAVPRCRFSLEKYAIAWGDWYLILAVGIELGKWYVVELNCSS
mgnify:CR=1 FL=1